MIKIIAFAAFIAVVRAGLLAPAPLAAVAAPVAEEYDPHPQYSYGYDIHDALTGDSKSHHETRDGDVVQGSYSLVDPDGTRRIVEYVADWATGFHAVVRKEPLAVAAPVAAAPLLTKAILH